jgi:very-short-patch-repair endonuclease
VDVIEWDAFRTGVLTGAGWSVVRVWSPHFYRDPRGHVARLVEAAERAEIRN